MTRKFPGRSYSITSGDGAALSCFTFSPANRIRTALRGVAFGPSIGPCCFEVGDEVADVVEALVPEAVLRPAARRPHVDLWRTNAALLERAGLAREQIDARPPCTVCHPERFFSYRRDGAEIGQMLSFITLGRAPTKT